MENATKKLSNSTDLEFNDTVEIYAEFITQCDTVTANQYIAQDYKQFRDEIEKIKQKIVT